MEILLLLVIVGAAVFCSALYLEGNRRGSNGGYRAGRRYARRLKRPPFYSPPTFLTKNQRHN